MSQINSGKGKQMQSKNPRKQIPAALAKGIGDRAVEAIKR